MMTTSSNGAQEEDNDSTLPQLSPTELIRCLERQPTFYGPDSAFHCIFGLPSGDEKATFREELASFVDTSFIDKLFTNFNLLNITPPSLLYPRHYVHQQNSKLVHKSAVFPFDKQFSLRITKDDKDFRNASELKEEFFKHEDDRLQPTITQPEDFNWPSGKQELSSQKYQNLLSEYAKYIRAPWSMLGLAELELLAIRNQWKIHVYTNQEDGKYDEDDQRLPRIKYQCTLNDAGPGNDGDKYLLYEDDGAWQPLKVKPKMQRFLQQRAVQTTKWKDKQPAIPAAVVELDFQNWANGLGEKYNTSIKMLLSDDTGQNELLQRLLLFRFIANDDSATVEIPNEGDMSLLAQFVAHCQVRNTDPIFYLHIVREFRQEHWKYEFLLLEIEEQLLAVLEEEERVMWREILRNLSDGMVSTLRKRIKAAGEPGALDKENLEKLLKLLEKVEIYLKEDDVEKLGTLPLDNWYSKLRLTYWHSKIDQEIRMNTVQLTDEEKNEAVFMLLQLESKEGELNCEQIFNKLRNNESVNCWPETSNILQKYLDSIDEERTKQESVNEIIIKMTTNQHSNLRKVVKETMAIDGNVVGCFKKNNSDVIKGKWLQKSLNLTDDNSIMEFIKVYDKIVKSKMGFPLRNTQKVAIVTLLKSEAKTLAQVSTGEGKSLIVAGVAIGRVKAGQTVDIITSNDVLAKRDSESKLADIYAAFKIKVGNNCSQKAEKRTDGYKCPVVYGQMSNFQRDYLLDTFYGYKIRDDRPFDSVIVDEVDCMLLDRGNNVLYLSHDIPGMEMLESLYIFIKERMKTADEPLGPIKSAILYDLYGEITKKDLQLALSIKKEETEKLWAHLTQRKVVDRRGRLLIDDAKFITENRVGYDGNVSKRLVSYLKQVVGRDVPYDPYGKIITEKDLQLALSIEKEKTEKLLVHLTQKKVVDQQGRLLIDDAKLITEKRVRYDGNLSGKLVFFLKQVAGRERRIRIPFHFLSFVERHLDTWLENAVKALKSQKGERYVVGPSASKPKSVVIIDPDTGTDQTSSQWGEALHQFLQLKEGCLLTLQSLKSVFISNVTYIKRYAKLAGLTGTLGSKPERHFLRTTYKCDYVTVPTAFPRKFTMKPARVVKTSDEWLKAIVEETRQTIFSSDENKETPRSLVIFCESIKEVNRVHQRLETDLKSELDNKKIHSYTRDYEEFVFESSELDVGHVIVATNLAGRGTDIKISEELSQNGGLHICLTYLPDNLRIEEQAFGRAARKTEPGSGILIVHHPSQQPSTINRLKFERNSKESLRISRLAQDLSDNIRKQEECFRHFSQYFQYLKHKLELRRSKKKSKLLDEQEVSCVCSSALDQWALWLDSITSFESQSLEQLLRRLKTFLNSLKLTKDIDWMTPGRLIVMAKHLATRKTEPNLLKADAILRKIVRSKERFFYPAAHYYRAFIAIKQGNLLSSIPKRKRLISMLQTTEILLREHIAMQKSFLSAVSPDDVYYKRQKKNMVEILEDYLKSVQSLLGRQCSIGGLIKAGIDATKVNQLMEALTKDRIITCKVNQEIPGGKDVVRQVANKHAVRELSLRKILYNEDDKEKKKGKKKEKKEEKKKAKKEEKEKEKEKKEDEEEFFFLLFKDEGKVKEKKEEEEKREEEDLEPEKEKEKENEKEEKKQKKEEKVKNKNKKEYRYIFNEMSMKDKLAKVQLLNGTSTVMDRCWTRDKFWNFLSENDVLHKLADNVVVPEIEYEFHSEIEPIQMDQRGFEDYFFYNPKYRTKKDLEDKGKIMLTRKYAKTNLNEKDYAHVELTSESCKFALLDATKLHCVIASTFGKLEQSDLVLVNIDNEEDRKDIWIELKAQNIVDQQGQLSSEYNDNKPFNYSKCPVYEAPVRSLIEKTFAAEKVWRKWLDVNDTGRFFAIDDLPLQSDRDLLWDDLLATHIVSVNLVTDVLKKRKLKRTTIDEVISELVRETQNKPRNKLLKNLRDFLQPIFPTKAAKEKKQLVDCLSSYLKSCQSLYAAMETPDAWLRSLKDDKIKKDDKEEVSDQNHHLMSLVGFDHVIVLEEKKWSDKMICRAVAIIFIGALQLAVAVTLLYCGICPQIAVGLIGTGVGDVLFAMNALLTGEHFHWADYGRHKQKQTVKLLTKILVGIAVDGTFILEGDVPLEDILKTVAKELQKAELTTRSHSNEVDINIYIGRVLRILQEREQEKVNCHSQTTDHIQTCLKLMKKTKDPKLFSILIRDQVPIDQFCADALSCVLSTHLEEKVSIQIEGTEQVFDHHETVDRHNTSKTSVVKIERGVVADDDRCMLREFIQIKQMDKTKETELRHSLSSLIETDQNQDVIVAIRKVWQNRNLQINLFGSHVTSKQGIEKTDFAVTGIVPKDSRQLAKRNIFHDDYANIHSAIKDVKKSKIPCHRYPVLTVTYPEDGATAKAEDFNIFRHVQRGHLERGQFRNAIWNTVQTNWMPIAKRISETGDDLKETHVASIKDHFKKSANKGLIDGRKGELEELNKILDSKMARFSSNEAQGNPAVYQP